MATKRTRIELHDILKKVLGSEYVYFQPPETLKMTYPCIVYRLSNIKKRNANNAMYDRFRLYSVILVDKKSDSPIQDRILELPMCTFDRYYSADNLNHYAYNLYF